MPLGDHGALLGILSMANQSSAELEVEQLRQRLKQVEMERDIFKKALSIFSRQM